MSWPTGVTLRTCSLGPAFGIVTGADYGCSVSITCSRPEMTWGASGSDGFGDKQTLSFDPGQEVTFQLPVTDQDGWYLNGQPISVADGKQSHVYTLIYQPWTLNSLGRPTPVGTSVPLTNLAVATGDGTLDLDLSVSVPGAQGGTVTIPDFLAQLVAPATADATAAATDAQAAQTAAEAAAQQAHDISNLDTSDGVVAALVDDPDSVTAGKLDARIAGQMDSIQAGRACSTDGTNGLPEPSGSGMEFVINADGLDDIRYNGVSL